MSENSTNKTVGLMSDDDGNPSSMRAMSVMALVIAGALALLPVLGVGDCTVESTIILWFLGAAFGGKVFQKFAEKK